MGDTGDGSSSAAQSAQDQTNQQKRGFLSRLFASGTSSGRPATTVANGISSTANGHTLSPAGGLPNLNRVRLQEVAVPRADIISVPIDISLDDLVGNFRKSGLTRLPVFTDTLDTPIGFIHLKDLALKHGFANTGATFDLGSMLRPLLFAPPSMPIGVLLQKMQNDRIHMALVIDEYGGVDGLVTIEDLIEQVIGEIEDEHDATEQSLWTEEKPGIFTMASGASLSDFEAEIGRRLVDLEPEDEVDTLGGLVFLLAGRVPQRGEVIHHEGGVEFEVLEADPRRIKRLKVVLPPLSRAG